MARKARRRSRPLKVVLLFGAALLICGALLNHMMLDTHLGDVLSRQPHELSSTRKNVTIPEVRNDTADVTNMHVGESGVVHGASAIGQVSLSLIRSVLRGSKRRGTHATKAGSLEFEGGAQKTVNGDGGLEKPVSGEGEVERTVSRGVEKRAAEGSDQTESKASLRGAGALSATKREKGRRVPVGKQRTLASAEGGESQTGAQHSTDVPPLVLHNLRYAREDVDETELESARRVVEEAKKALAERAPSGVSDGGSDEDSDGFSADDKWDLLRIQNKLSAEQEYAEYVRKLEAEEADQKARTAAAAARPRVAADEAGGGESERDVEVEAGGVELGENAEGVENGNEDVRGGVELAENGDGGRSEEADGAGDAGEELDAGAITADQAPETGDGLVSDGAVTSKEGGAAIA